MSNEQQSQIDIYGTALKVFSEDELTSMPLPQLKTLGRLLSKRMRDESKPEPTLAELQGIKELVTEHLWSPAFNRL